ncbi:hypothetical protein [Sphingomonas sp. CARO-RG-8B-R24-01]|uniref:hypothetical protein n=1 Tax=Sphingomonas sp. CARO-RG-8B-R24-01 TaxID=2914831 RepID=UPI001F583DCA|nr:hypothetical protein [Sphingomonas sp. CARO-RG-8B-R24-01]
MKILPSSLWLAGTLLLATPVAAQTSAPATPLPDLDGYSLPSSRPTPRVAPDAEPTTGVSVQRPAPAPTPSTPVVAVPSVPPRVVPTVRTTPVPRPTPVPRAGPPERPVPVVAPTPAGPPTIAVPAPVRKPDPVAVPTAPPVAVRQTPTPTAPADSVSPPRSSIWALVAGGVIIALAVAGWILWRRRAGNPSAVIPDEASFEQAPPAEPEPASTPAAAARAVAPRITIPVARPRIEIECIATRAGTNLLSAAVEYRIIVRNVGDAIAHAIRLDVRLLGMGVQHDALLAALFAMPLDTSIAAPFDLLPGTAVDLGGMAMHPKETIETVDLGGRAMVVPLLAINLRYGLGDAGAGQTAAAFVIGQDRGAGGKLQPFRLDSARMADTVAVIAYPGGVTG